MWPFTKRHTFLQRTEVVGVNCMLQWDQSHFNSNHEPHRIYSSRVCECIITTDDLTRGLEACVDCYSKWKTRQHEG